MEKISKLQTLAERAGTEHEAQVAAAKMQRLLLKHNLTTLDIETFRNERGRSVQVMTIPADKSPWKAKLAGVIASHHFCVAVRQDQGDGPVFVLWGREENLLVAHSVYGWLVRLVPRLADEAWEREAHERIWSPWSIARIEKSDSRKWKHSYRLGVIDGISEAYKQAALADTHEDTWGLVPLLQAEADEARKQDVGEIDQYANYGRMTSGDAYARGYHQGKAIDVRSNQLEGNHAG